MWKFEIIWIQKTNDLKQDKNWKSFLRDGSNEEKEDEK
jgi:hypothetical protein